MDATESFALQELTLPKEAFITLFGPLPALYPREVDFCTTVVGNVLVISQPVFDYMASEDSAWIKTGSDFSAGMSDTITGGLTGRLRGAMGYTDVVDQQSSMYRYGGYAGQAVNVGLMFANPAAMAGWARTGLQVMNGMSQVGGLLGAAEAAGQGDFRTAGTLLLGAAASRLRGAGSACGKGLGGVLEKGLWAYNTAQRVSTIQEKLQSGDIVGATLDTLEAAVGVRRMLQACFVAGTPLRGEFGAHAIESFRVGDRIWSRDENDPQGVDGLQMVEEVFVRLGRVLWLTVNSQRIGTTSEHPFFSPVHGWCNAGDLSVGEAVLLRDGSYGIIEGMEAGEYATVYNLRVADWHTYFVGEDHWGFEVWAHNRDGCKQHSVTGNGNKAARRAYELEQKRAAQALDSPSGHSYADHGAHTKPSQHETRLRTGVTPSGRIRPTTASSRFASDEMHAIAGSFATTELNSRLAARSTRRRPLDKVELSFSLPGAGETFGLSSQGGLTSSRADTVKAIYGRNSGGSYDLITMYPE